MPCIPRIRFFAQRNWSAERTPLFNTLVADPRCTMAQQQALFSDSAYLKVLVKERHRMYVELMNRLGRLHQLANPESWWQAHFTTCTTPFLMPPSGRVRMQ